MPVCSLFCTGNHHHWQRESHLPEANADFCSLQNDSWRRGGLRGDRLCGWCMYGKQSPSSLHNLQSPLSGSPCSIRNIFSSFKGKKKTPQMPLRESRLQQLVLGWFQELHMETWILRESHKIVETELHLTSDACVRQDTKIIKDNYKTSSIVTTHFKQAIKPLLIKSARLNKGCSVSH